MNKVLNLALGSALLVGAAALAIPSSADAYALIGGKLQINQRDFRCSNDFSDPYANDNQTPHANWPGYQGANMSMWKAGSEWSSRNFGDGSGDGTQNSVGDGLANFNFFWNGEASNTGGTNDNIISHLNGSSGGVLAYCEMPHTDGWRIRFYESWSWDDNPGNTSSARMDLQGVATHELGHALGLDHSSNGSATMYYAASGNGVSSRSIESDDKNGVQAIYDPRDTAVLPTITSLAGSLAAGGTCTVTGTNFTATNNTVWLNSDVLNSNDSGGEPYKITGVSSSNGGTTLSFTVPSSGIESGAIHIQMDGAGQKSLSEGHPFDLAAGPPPTDSILLTVTDTTPNTGQNVTFDWSQAPAWATYELLYSFRATGSVINGQNFDIGAPHNLANSGTMGWDGTGSYTVRIPGKGAGRTVYLELRADDSTGTTFDSNMVTLNIN
ncbi:MAG: matrixin family metalloprotease [Planctomycetes bacterium]|jgi:hypothetical protein|nr:matrixin family metalloprotease [Planctomycetota bacterium]MBT4029320.1 matrixin family metalloprotease [Planctomycetota bacterium]MBT7012643.1 matrixin family metalloprotease [Planctomycetota bacterium]